MPYCAKSVNLKVGAGSTLTDLNTGQPVNNFMVIDYTNTNLTACAFVVETGAEYFSRPLPALTPDEALVISSAVAALWAGAWCFKALVKTLNIGDSHEAD